MSDIENALDYYYDILAKTLPEDKTRAYALIAISGIERIKKIEPVPSGKYGFACPRCKNDLGIDREDINVYDVPPPHNCEHCGQALTWTRFMTMTGQAKDG